MALRSPLKPVPGVDPTSPAMSGQRRGAIPAWGKGCSPSLGVPRRVQKPGLGTLQPPTVTEPPGTVLLAAPASLGSAVDGRGWNSLADVKANLFSQQLLGSRAREWRCCSDPMEAELRAASFHPKFHAHLRSQGPLSALGHNPVLSAT